MKPDRDIERLLDRWFAEGPMEVPDRVIDVVEDRIGRQSQRPAWRLPWRDIHMNSTQRMVAAAAAVILAAVVGLAIVGRPTDSGIGGRVSPSPLPATPQSSTSPVATSPSPAPTIYTSKSMEVPISFRLADGFRIDFDVHDGIGLLHPDMAAGIGSLAALQVTGPSEGDPHEPWPAQLGAWLRSQPGFAPWTNPSITVGGRPATSIDVDVTPTAGAPKRVIFWSGGAWDRLGIREIWRIVEVRTGPGEGIVVIMGTTWDKWEAGAMESFDRLVASIEFVAPSPSSSP